LAIQHDFLNCIIGGYLDTKFQISTITHSGDMIPAGLLAPPQP